MNRDIQNFIALRESIRSGWTPCIAAGAIGWDLTGK